MKVCQSERETSTGRKKDRGRERERDKQSNVRVDLPWITLQNRL